MNMRCIYCGEEIDSVYEWEEKYYQLHYKINEDGKITRRYFKRQKLEQYIQKPDEVFCPKCNNIIGFWKDFI